MTRLSAYKSAITIASTQCENEIILIIRIFIQVKAISVPTDAAINNGPVFKLKLMYLYKEK